MTIRWAGDVRILPNLNKRQKNQTRTTMGMSSGLFYSYGQHNQSGSYDVFVSCNPSIRRCSEILETLQDPASLKSGGSVRSADNDAIVWNAVRSLMFDRENIIAV